MTLKVKQINKVRGMDIAERYAYLDDLTAELASVEIRLAFADRRRASRLRRRRSQLVDHRAAVRRLDPWWLRVAIRLGLCSPEVV